MVECIACNKPAEIKDYRNRNLIVDGYPACLRHAQMDDGNFWKAVNKKTDKNNKIVLDK